MVAPYIVEPKIKGSDIYVSSGGLIQNPVINTNGIKSSDSHLFYGGGAPASQPDYHTVDPRADDQSNRPTNPGLRYDTSSAYGRVIPISFGKRRLSGNLIQSSALVPRMIGTKQVCESSTEVPTYEDPPIPDEGVPTADADGGPSWVLDDDQMCGGSASGCDTRGDSGGPVNVDGTTFACGAPGDGFYMDGFFAYTGGPYITVTIQHSEPGGCGVRTYNEPVLSHTPNSDGSFKVQFTICGICFVEISESPV